MPPNLPQWCMEWDWSDYQVNRKYFPDHPVSGLCFPCFFSPWALQWLLGPLLQLLTFLLSPLALSSYFIILISVYIYALTWSAGFFHAGEFNEGVLVLKEVEENQFALDDLKKCWKKRTFSQIIPFLVYNSILLSKHSKIILAFTYFLPWYLLTKVFSLQYLLYKKNYIIHEHYLHLWIGLNLQCGRKH